LGRVLSNFFGMPILGSGATIAKAAGTGAGGCG
jgi:hypothetical protein